MSQVERALEELKKVLVSKNKDYKIGGEFSNFEFAADVVGAGMQTEDVMLTQIGIKLGRILGLRTSEDLVPNNESLQDSYMDLAGYAIILYAYASREDS